MGPFYSNSLENYLERTPYGFTFNQIMKSAMEFEYVLLTNDLASTKTK